MSLSAITRINWSCAHPLYGRFYGIILVCGFTKSNSCKNLSRTTNKRVSRSVNGPKTWWPPIPIFTKKFCSAMKLTFGWKGTLINKIVAFEVMINHNLLERRCYILKKSLFGVFYRLIAPHVAVNGERYRAKIKVAWPLRSCDLTTLDYFSWGYVNLLIYADKLMFLFFNKCVNFSNA